MPMPARRDSTGHGTPVQFELPAWGSRAAQSRPHPVPANPAPGLTGRALRSRSAEARMRRSTVPDLRKMESGLGARRFGRSPPRAPAPLAELVAPLESARVLKPSKEPDREPAGELLHCLRHFPNAVKGKHVDQQVFRCLSERGFSVENTLLAHSSCPDEVNYDSEGDLVNVMHRRWGEKFTLGGLAGMSFCGETGWGAFSAHVPTKDGRILILFGPHTGIGSNGEVGKLRREGQDHDSTCCGAACAALACEKPAAEILTYDMQQSLLTSLMLPHREKIKADACPDRALVYANFEVVSDYLRRIIRRPEERCVEIAVVGGIMVNLPEPFDDRFVPLVFECYDCRTGEVHDLFKQAFEEDPSTHRWRESHAVGARASPRMKTAAKRRAVSAPKRSTPTPPDTPDGHHADGHRAFRLVREKWASRAGQFFPLVDKEKEWRAAEPAAELAECLRHFPTATRMGGVEGAVYNCLAERGFTPMNTLFAHATCPDEVNYDEPETDIVNLMQRRWGSRFTLGGLAGMPFCGQTGWGAFSAHVPNTNKDGRVLVLFAPHTGIATDGGVGQVRREGQDEDTTCCGAAMAAWKTRRGPREIRRFDVQQSALTSLLAPYCQSIDEHECPERALVYANFDIVADYLRRIIRNPEKNCTELAIVGGIMINLPEPFEDRFVPLVFECMDCKTFEVHDLFDKAFPQASRDPWRATHGAGSPKAKGFPSNRLTGVPRVAMNWASRAGRFFPLIDDEKDFRAQAPQGELEHCIRHFPTTRRNGPIEASIHAALSQRGWSQETTTFAVAVCPDEVNFADPETDLVHVMHRRWGDKFELGGPAAMAFCGETGWAALAGQVPPGGNVLILFAPHTGVGTDGELGKVRRQGHKHDTTCCGVAQAAFQRGSEGDVELTEFDVQQTVLARCLRRAHQQLSGGEATSRDLIAANVAASRDYLRGIMAGPHSGLDHCGEVAVVGGLIVNLPEPFENRFVPQIFECRDKTGEVTDLFESFGVGDRDNLLGEPPRFFPVDR
eukprot:TRINITY_DN18727_c0_g1_i1.p1 TRINITY_DN18727_c0_g1~~TRINITY_DN18727_c0_g1_i1.p1  ORF type:complete len:1014 (+),score=254.31 TRINITY_DN18727_c0_g1_i1:70-3111(+)